MVSIRPGEYGFRTNESLTASEQLQALIGASDRGRSPLSSSLCIAPAKGSLFGFVTLPIRPSLRFLQARACTFLIEVL